MSGKMKTNELRGREERVLLERNGVTLTFVRETGPEFGMAEYLEIDDGRPHSENRALIELEGSDLKELGMRIEALGG